MSTTIHTDGIATREADARTILRHMGTHVTLLSDPTRCIVDLGCGVRLDIGRSRKLIVKLAANDTYAVEIVRMRRDFTAVSEFLALDVYADRLGEVILDAVTG